LSGTSIVVVRQEPASALTDYATIPISFEVCEVFDVTPVPDRSGGYDLTTRRVAEPYSKDYDAAGGSPADWPGRFSVSDCVVFSAFVESARVGGAVVIPDSLSGVPDHGFDSALLWDLRVRPEWRRRGVGAKLFHAVEKWATESGFKQLQVETQNNNVAACRFYAEQGCVLREVHRGAYSEFPNEIQLLWFKTLGSSQIR
jgi:GNAT superfamily N-acetyltransferase